jgi:hypothetical protein
MNDEPTIETFNVSADDIRMPRADYIHCIDRPCIGGCSLKRQEPEDTPYGRLAAGTHCSTCGRFMRDDLGR